MRLLTLERVDAAAVITLARPERRNALSLDLLSALAETLDIVASDGDVRSVILAGEGPAFSAGHDLEELSGRDEEDYRRIFSVCSRVMLKLHEIPQPVIAEVGGVATAAGCQLVASCDLAVASEEARFATPGVRIGLFCTTPMVPVVRAVGRKRAMEMLLTGEFIDAPTALAWGLVNRVVPAGELRAATLVLAARIAQASPYVVATGKRAFYDHIQLSEAEAYERAQCVMVESAQAPEAREGVSAFLEKRPPVWSK